MAYKAALIAGEQIRREFHRSGGPRGSHGHAVVDEQAEREIRALLTSVFPDWSYRGEETGVQLGSDTKRWWVVDPNDGTSDYLKGLRGSAVSIALVEDGEPVLGVVYSPLYPDDRGDLIAWARGLGPPERNGVPFQRSWPGALSAAQTVFVSQYADRRPEANLRCVQPARYRGLPSVAYRLALTAAGEAVVGTSLQHLHAHDVAAGDALLRAVGGVLLDGHGQVAAYGPTAEASVRRCFGGDPQICQELASRDWGEALGGDVRGLGTLPFPLRPGRGRTVSDPDLLARAQGCLLGQFAGDSLGGLVEFSGPQQVTEKYPDGPRFLEDGGFWNILAGQPTDDTEMALALARSLGSNGRFETDWVQGAYRTWLESGPFDLGNTVRQGLTGPPSTESQANGSLMRCAPLALASWSRPNRLLTWTREDSRLTHPHPLCVQCCEVFLVAVEAGLAGADPSEMAEVAANTANGEAAQLLNLAATDPPDDFLTHAGWVKVAFQNAFFHLLHTDSLEEALVETVRHGGDTDTNAAIAGALLGAAHGREAIPQQWRLAIQSCHPSPAFEACGRPRPPFCWPSDVLELAEVLLSTGTRAD